MRKNQKFSKQEMYLAIEKWRSSRLSQTKFCSLEKLSVKTFAYWLRKYKQEKGFPVKKNNGGQKAFIQVKVSKTTNNRVPNCGSIKVIFPNGAQNELPRGRAHEVSKKSQLTLMHLFVFFLLSL
jgi:hypothetical protein